MIIASSYDELIDVQIAIDNLNTTKPSIYQKFINLVKLTRQFQYGYQYMGTLLMDEDSSEFHPISQNDYVLSVYHAEVEKLKRDNKFIELKQVLKMYKQVSYAKISKLALGENPKALVGPTIIR